MVTINNYIKSLSSELFIRYNSTERPKINKSLDEIIKRLNSYFGNKISEIIVFGSYTRGTILPRDYDNNSDIDLMIVFNTTDYNEKNPETYRNNLKAFVDKKYIRSLSSKDLPSIVLELKNIKFDLVPAVVSKNWFSSSIYIPDSGNEWQDTDPNGFNDELTKANTKYNSIVKPIIRLMKYWNTRNGSPYESFKLEQIIADMNFSGDDYESGLFYAIENLPTYRESENLKKKVKTLKNNKDWVVEYLSRNDTGNAKKRLHKIIP